MIARDFSTALQITDNPVLSLEGYLIQSITLRGAMYSEVATLVHRLFEVMSYQPSFVAEAVEKSSIFLIPQPSHFFRIERASHLTQEKIILGCLPFQRN